MALKIQGFCYVTDTPDLFSKSLDKTHAIYGAEHERNRTKHPLKFNWYSRENGNLKLKRALLITSVQWQILKTI